MLGSKNKLTERFNGDKAEAPTYPLLALARHRLFIDGKGVTTLVAGAGCPLSCAYCINRELLTRTPKPVSPKELIEKVRVDDLYFRATGGGLTFGGGETLLHMDFYEELRPLCQNWRLTAETCLNVPRETAVRAASVFDAFIIDVKSLDPDIYLRYTGREMGETLGNLEYLIEAVGAQRLTVRVPLIPNFNDEADREKTRRTLEKLGVKDMDLFEYAVKRSTDK
ncbi:MAG: radical SAM protein [Clostridia bacterium]|nr:radical SAM protein [Clostridia bacterium]